MVFGFGTGGIDASSKWSIKYDGNSMIESDDFTFNSSFRGSTIFSNGCFGGGKFNWGAFAGQAIGAGVTLGLAFLLRGKGGNGGLGCGSGLFGGGLGAGGSIWNGGYGAGGLGGDLYGMNIYGGGLGGGSNPCPISLHKTPTVADGTGATDGTGTGTGDASKTDGADKDKKGSVTDDASKTGKTPTSSTGEGDKAKQGSGAGDASKTAKKTPVSEGNGTPTGSYLKALIDGGKVDGKEYDGQAAGKVDTKGIGVKSLKESENTRKEWGDTKANGTTSAREKDDYKDAVKLGKANGGNQDEMAGTNNDYPKYFTITDRTSHNEYTFEFSRVTDDGTLMYKFSAQDSNLTKDDQEKYNNTDWIVNSAASGQEFAVTISGGEIVLGNGQVYVAHKQR